MIQIGCSQSLVESVPKAEGIQRRVKQQQTGLAPETPAFNEVFDILRELDRRRIRGAFVYLEIRRGGRNHWRGKLRDQRGKQIVHELTILPEGDDRTIHL